MILTCLTGTCTSARRHRERRRTSGNTSAVQNLKACVIKLLKAFYEETDGRKPKRIIFYRDGISDSQFSEV